MERLDDVARAADPAALGELRLEARLREDRAVKVAVRIAEPPEQPFVQ